MVVFSEVILCNCSSSSGASSAEDGLPECVETFIQVVGDEECLSVFMDHGEGWCPPFGKCAVGFDCSGGWISKGLLCSFLVV